MNRNTFTIIVSIFTLILLNNCEKQTNEPSDSSTKLDSKFIIGLNNDCIDITTLNPTIEIIAPAYIYTHQNFDIDKDGISDFELRSDHISSPGGLKYQKSSIKIVNSSFQISVIEMSDTLHRCIHSINDTIISYMVYNNYSNVTCSGDGIDSVYSPNTFSYPKIYSTGDTLNLTESWSNDDLTLSYYNYMYFLISPPITYSIVRGNWNNQNMKYVLFKKDHEGIYIYGWLRLSIDNIKEIRFYEYAIQKINME